MNEKYQIVQEVLTNASLLALLAAVIAGIILQYINRRREKIKVIELLKNDCAFNWKNIDWCRIVTAYPWSVYHNYKDIKGVSIKGNPVYYFSIASLKIFETEGANITRYLNKKQSEMFWELFNLLFDLENTRKVLEKIGNDDDNYEPYQKMFVYLANKSMKLYVKLVNDIQK